MGDNIHLSRSSSAVHSNARFNEARVGEILQLKGKIQILDETDCKNYDVFSRYEKQLQTFFNNITDGQQKVEKRDISQKEIKTAAKKGAISFIYPGKNEKSIKDELSFGCLGRFWISVLSFFGFKWKVAEYVEQFACEFFKKLSEDQVVHSLLDLEEAKKRQEECQKAFLQVGKIKTPFNPSNGKEILELAEALRQAGIAVRTAQGNLDQILNTYGLRQLQKIARDNLQKKFIA